VPDARPVRGIYETVIYADDVPAVVAFYSEVVGLREIEAPAPDSAAFRLDDGTLLLIFRPSMSSAPGRLVPAHRTTGAGPLAFRMGEGELDPFTEGLSAKGIEIEREITWPLGGRSVYVRDPAGNSVEFVEGEIWDE
jgi:catechol 2,3-dioxygenase-like lactoylglutathione lyase family enzyme